MRFPWLLCFICLSLTFPTTLSVQEPPATMSNMSVDSPSQSGDSPAPPIHEETDTSVSAESTPHVGQAASSTDMTNTPDTVPPVYMQDRDESVRAITKPSADVILSFVQPGLISEVSVKEGDTVKADTVIIRLDNSVELAQLAQIQAESEDTTQIQASEASLDQKRVDLRKIQKAAEMNAATKLEVEHAQLNVKIAELSLQLARFEHEQAKRKLTEMKTRLARMQINCPIDGMVEHIFRETGESANALEEVVQVVQIDPLWIDASVPMKQARSLKVGQSILVRFPGPHDESIKGEIIFIAAVADAASETLRVRIQVPNKTHRPAGEQVRVICSGVK